MSVRVTVLMPVYNASAYIREAIESILSQTMRDFELLVVDDGSTDDTAAIITSYKDERIRFLQNEKNSGISATLNRGIEMASSELIARMDADDISYPERLEKQLAFMDRRPECGLLCTWARVVTAEKKPVRLERYRSDFYYYNLNFECWIYHPTVMFRRSVARQCGMYSKPYSEDFDLFWKMGQITEVHALEECLLDYRLSPTSLNTVSHKSEYDSANRENVLRNLQHYMGSDFRIDDASLECLRHNFGPITASGSAAPVIECIRLLDRITARIMGTQNPNNNGKNIAEAARHKKDFIVEQTARLLPNRQKVALSIHTGRPEIMVWKLHQALRWRYNSIRQHFMKKNKQEQ